MAAVDDATGFTMSVRIENFPNLREHISEVETHSGIKWYTVSRRDGEYWTITLFCVPVHPKKRNISFRCEAFLDARDLLKLRISGVEKCILNGTQKISGKINFCSTIKDAMIGNVVTVLINVQLIASVITPNFDFSVCSDDVKSDVVLLVDDREFHVNKSLLSFFSPVFSTMFSEKYKESTVSRIPLEDVDADNFQVLLEVLYHKTDVTVENAQELLELVNYFDFKDIKSKCEQVLVNDSDDKVKLKEKLLLADHYMLQELIKTCIEKIESVSQLQDVTPEDVNVLNPQTIAQLLQKTIDLRSI